MRDVRKVKNRLELRLDSTQVFFLFAGLATFAGLVFVLGVLVGRGQRVAPDSSLVARATATPRVKLPSVRDQIRGSKGKVEAIYELDQPGNPNSIAAAIPTAQPTRKPVVKVTRAVVATSAAASTPRPPASRSRFTVQLAAYTDSDQAFEFVEKLRLKGIEAYSVTYQKPDGPTYHRVRVGRFVSKSEADKMARRVGTLVAGISPAVMRIEN